MAFFVGRLVGRGENLLQSWSDISSFPLSSSSVHTFPCDHHVCVDCFNGLVNKAAEVAEDEGARSSRLGTSVSCPLCRAKSRCKRLRTE